MVIGVGLFVKYAIDNNWINETFRTILGFTTGLILLFVAERLRVKYRTFSSLLAGGAFAIFYVTVAIAFHYYGIFSQTSAFIILIFVTILMSILAILYDRRELAIISLTGGFLAPFLVSTGSGNYITLFTYIAILNIGMFILSFRKKWNELPVISFVFTTIVMALYVFSSRYTEMTQIQSVLLFSFSTLFYIIFLLPLITILKNTDKKNALLLSTITLNNFVYMGFGLYFINMMNSPVKIVGLLPLIIATINLILIKWLKNENKPYKILEFTLLGVTLTFVSLAIPIQLEGNFITLFWASEMVLVLWLFLKSRIKIYEYFSFTLIILTLISFILDVKEYYIYKEEILFFNSKFIVNLYTGLTFITFFVLMQKFKEILINTKLLSFKPWNTIVLTAGLVIIYYTFIYEFNKFFGYYMSGVIIELFTSIYILGIFVLFRKKLLIEKTKILYNIALAIPVLWYWVNIHFYSFHEINLTTSLLSWCNLLVIIVIFYWVGKLRFSSNIIHRKGGKGFTIYYFILITLLWLCAISNFTYQIGIHYHNEAAHMVGLSLLGFAEMWVGMKTSRKIIRIISLVTLGIVLFKLMLIDVWSMHTGGKVLVFILLGVILLILSFLYQKLKDVLFKNDDEKSI